MSRERSYTRYVQHIIECIGLESQVREIAASLAAHDRDILMALG